MLSTGARNPVRAVSLVCLVLLCCDICLFVSWALCFLLVLAIQYELFLLFVWFCGVVTSISLFWRSRMQVRMVGKYALVSMVGRLVDADGTVARSDKCSRIGWYKISDTMNVGS